MKTNFITKFYFFVALFIFSMYFGKDIASVNKTINDKNISPFIFVSQPSGNMHEASALFNTFTYVNDPIDLSSILIDLGILTLLPSDKYAQLLSIVNNANICLKSSGNQALISQSIASILVILKPMYTVIITKIKVSVANGHGSSFPISILLAGITKDLISGIIHSLPNIIISSQQSECLKSVLQELQALPE
ncbi:hypothetical protein NZD88_16950 [Chryseobacterium antibioticum]|uniref:Uncharacterized protein n=1 Tax=Chryseobacterium pyrolae TaxID=2987481 RepID=A0ABT2IKX1_9FLAO|nr:hypothetical protein [Chryseobacterium pyrolae]MCT2409239.1 hypothetical protein [Chryseobacterium pyrolae]